eukprot:s2512_g10.t1
MVLKELGLAAWHINAKTPFKKREAVIAAFAGSLQKQVHVLVTVEILGEGINIPNADTCMFVEPRNSYRSIIQAIGRVLRRHPAKTLAHIVLPAVAIPYSRAAASSQAECKGETIEKQNMQKAREVTTVLSTKPELSRASCKSEGLGMREKLHRKEEHPVLHGTGKGRVLSNLDLEGCHEVPEAPKLGAIGLASPLTEVDKTSHRQATEMGPTLDADGQRKSEACTEQPGHSEALLPNEASFTPCGSSFSCQRKVIPTAYLDPEGRRKNGSVGAGVQLLNKTLHKIGLRATGRCEETKAPQNEFGHDPDRLALVESQQLSREQRASSSSALSQLGERPGRTNSWKSKSLRGLPALDQKFRSQLDRFLATLMMADHRLAGTTAAHRIQVADCSFADPCSDITEGLMNGIYSHLSVIISQTDPWETRLRELEQFVDQHGRLPWRSSNDGREKTLGIWLSNQGVRLKMHRMPIHRLQKLLASSVPIRRRADGWQTGDTDWHFKETCEELRQHILLHKSVPKKASRASQSSSQKLGIWLANLRRSLGLLNADKKKMLQEVHPLVKALVETWETNPRLLDVPRWELRFNQLSSFVVATGRLPKSRAESQVERSHHGWLQAERKRLLAGYMPRELARRLRTAHPLIAAFADATAQGQRRRAHAHEKSR